jgi:hypothetical protein
MENQVIGVTEHGGRRKDGRRREVGVLGPEEH